MNASEVLLSYQKSKISKVSNHRGMPISLSIEPTTSCNLRCPECPSGLRSFTRPTGMLQRSMFNNLIDELKDSLAYLTFYFQGEPYLNKDFLPMVAYASSKGIYTSTSTNAHYLNDETARATIESGLKRLLVSIDGTTQETYESYRVGGKLDKVWEGLNNLLKWKKTLKSSSPHILIQFLVVKPNEHQIPEILEIGKKLNVEVALKTAQIYDYENGSDLIPTQSKYSRYYQKPDGKWSIKNALDNHCWKMWHSAVVTWDGKVLPCCFDKDAHHSMGAYGNVSFEEIWRSKPYDEFRQAVITSRSSIEMCSNCTEGTKIWAD